MKALREPSAATEGGGETRDHRKAIRGKDNGAIHKAGSFLFKPTSIVLEFQISYKFSRHLKTYPNCARPECAKYDVSGNSWKQFWKLFVSFYSELW